VLAAAALAVASGAGATGTTSAGGAATGTASAGGAALAVALSTGAAVAAGSSVTAAGAVSRAERSPSTTPTPPSVSASATSGASTYALGARRGCVSSAAGAGVAGVGVSFLNASTGPALGAVTELGAAGRPAIGGAVPGRDTSVARGCGVTYGSSTSCSGCGAARRASLNGTACCVSITGNGGGPPYPCAPA
jgi:hypothetical protein